jgi:hypothetical protein
LVSFYDLIQDFKASISQDSVEQKSIVSNYQKLTSCLRQTISELENEKVKLPFYYDIFLVVSGFSGRSNICFADSSGQPVS